MDKVKERELFNLIYKENDNIKVIDMEQPDFKIEIIDTGVKIGVEITELFIDATEARLNNIPNYFTDLIDEEKYKHKDDIEVLDVVTLTTIPDSPEEKTIKLKGLMRREIYNFDDLARNVCHAMHEKNQKYDKYDKGLSQIDLLIYNYALPDLPDRKYLFDYLLRCDNFIEELITSKYREIYFLSKFSTDKIQYLNFKTQYFMQMFHFFSRIGTEYFKEKFLNIGREEFLKTFAVFLYKFGFSNIYISSRGVPALYYSTIKAIIRSNLTFFVKSIIYTVPNEIELIDKKYKGSLLIDDNFLVFAKKYMKENPIKTGVLVDIN